MGKINEDYAALVSAASGDLLPVVDISDTSMSANGTTKKITVGNLLGQPVIQPSGDATGVTDAARIMAAYADLGGNPGTIEIGPGTWYWVHDQVVIPQSGVSIIHRGPKWSCIVNAVGTGDTLQMYSTTSYSSGGGGPAGGGCEGFIIDGTSAGAGSAGLHIGDIYNLALDVGVRHFQGAGSKAAWFDNRYAANGCEQMHGRLWVETSTTHVQFDVNPAATYAPSGSFDRIDLTVFVDGKGKGDIVVLNNGAYIVDGKLEILGNTDYGTSQFWALKLNGPQIYSFTGNLASPCVFTAAGSALANGTAVSLLGGSLPAGFTASTTYWVVGASGTTFSLAATSGGAAINSTGSGSGTVFVAPTPFYSRIDESFLHIGLEVNALSGTQPATINFNYATYNRITGCTGMIDFRSFAGASGAAGSFQFDGPVYGDNLLQLPASSPVGVWSPADNGLLFGACPVDAVQTGTIMVAGTLYLVKLPARGRIAAGGNPLTLSTLWWGLWAAGTGASTGSFTGLYSSAGTLLTGSADIAAKLTGGTGPFSQNLTTAQAIAPGTFVWAALLANLASTQPTIWRSASSTTVPNMNLTAATYRYCTAGTGLTSLPGSITPSSNSQGTAIAYCAWGS